MIDQRMPSTYNRHCICDVLNFLLSIGIKEPAVVCGCINRMEPVVPYMAFFLTADYMTIATIDGYASRPREIAMSDR